MKKEAKIIRIMRPANEKAPRMVSLKEASEATGLPYGFIRSGCISGTILHIRSGSKYYVNLDRLIDQLNGVGTREA